MGTRKAGNPGFSFNSRFAACTSEDLSAYYSETGEQGCRLGNENIIWFIK